MEDVLKMCHDMHVVGLFKKNSYKSSLAKAMLESLLKDAWKYNKSCEISSKINQWKIGHAFE